MFPRNSSTVRWLRFLSSFVPLVCMLVFLTACPELLDALNNAGNNNTNQNDNNANDNNANDNNANDNNANDNNANDNNSNDNNSNDNDNDNGGDSGLTGKFVGNERCSLCHVSTHRNWSETLHARAYETLKKIGQNTNAVCLPCHTVGFGEPGGFVDIATTKSLAGVGCESCHGASRDHVENIEDETLRPAISMKAETCGRCHTGEHHPNFDDWMTSGHAHVTETPAEEFAAGEALNRCGICHSGDLRFLSLIRGEEVADNALQGVAPEDQTAVTCAICHDPHMRTGNAPEAEDGRDYQLRFPEVAFPFPTNTVEATTNPERFNLCGQCHHDRGRTWKDTSRPPHHSVQANFYTGEMPNPVEEGDTVTPIVNSVASVHLRATEQCATCHMHRQDFMSDQAPAVSGHTFQVNLAGCVGSGCHTSQSEITIRLETFQDNVQARLAAIADRLGDPATWEFTSNGGPDSAGQAAISDNIKKIRFLYHYMLGDGSLGIHNPGYAREILDKAEALLDDEGL